MTHPHASRHRARRLVATIIAVAGLLTIATTGNASAQDVGRLKAKAAQIAAALDKLQTKAQQLDQQYLSTGEDLTKTQHQIDENKVAVDDAQARMDQASKQAAGYLVSAYMGAGVGSNVALGAGDPNQAVNEKVLLETLQGGRLQMADDIRAAKSDLQARSADLAASDQAAHGADAMNRRRSRTSSKRACPNSSTCSTAPISSYRRRSRPNRRVLPLNRRPGSRPRLKPRLRADGRRTASGTTGRGRRRCRTSTAGRSIRQPDATTPARKIAGSGNWTRRAAGRRLQLEPRRRPCCRSRDGATRHALSMGRIRPGWIRLLGPHDVGLEPSRGVTSPRGIGAVRGDTADLDRPTPAR